MTQAKHDYFAPDTFGRSVQDSLGDDVMQRLREKLGGQEVRFPKPTSVLLDGHWLVEAMGRETAQQLCELFSDETTYIPKPLNNRLKDRPYSTFVADGLTHREMSARLGISMRQVRRDLSELNLNSAKSRARPRMAIRTNRKQIAMQCDLVPVE